MPGWKSKERVDTAVESHTTRHFNEHLLPLVRPVEEAWGGLESSPEAQAQAPEVLASPGACPAGSQVVDAPVKNGEA